MTYAIDRRAKFRGGNMQIIGPSYERTWVGVIEGTATAPTSVAGYAAWQSSVTQSFAWILRLVGL